jgi:hypothetical protein
MEANSEPIPMICEIEREKEEEPGNKHRGRFSCRSAPDIDLIDR